MGLEMVEVIMAVEEAFEIEIPDEEASECETVGKLYAAVLTRLGFNPPPYCVSSAVFYQARRALIDLHAVPRRSIAPSTSLERLLPATRRREDWRSLSRALGASLPDLQLPRWVREVSTVLNWALYLTCLAAYLVYPFWVAVLLSLVGICLWAAAERLSAPLAVRIPSDCETVGAVVRRVARLKEGIPPPSWHTWTTEAVWNTLRGIIVEELQVSPEEVRPEAHFIDDLGAG